MLVKVRASPIPAGRSTGHLSRQEAGEGWPSHGPGAQKEEVTKIFQGRDLTGHISSRLASWMGSACSQTNPERPTHEEQPSALLGYLGIWNQNLEGLF